MLGRCDIGENRMGGANHQIIEYGLSEFHHPYLQKGQFYDVIAFDKNEEQSTSAEYGLLCFEKRELDTNGNICLVFTEYDAEHEQHVGYDGQIVPLYVIFRLSEYSLQMTRRYIKYT